MDHLKIIYNTNLLSSLNNEQIKLLPKSKNDVSTAKKILDLPLNQTEKLLPLLLMWLQDLNWPVAQVLSPYLSANSLLIKSDIIEVLKGDDVMWQYWVLHELVDSSDLTLAKELENLLLVILTKNSDSSIKQLVEKILKKLKN